MKNFKRRHERGEQKPLLWAMYDVLKVEFIVGGLCQLTAAVVQVISPFILRYLIAFSGEAYAAQFTGGAPPDIGHGIGLVIAILVLQVIQSTCTNQFIFRGMMNGGQARAMLMSVIFEKAMRISGRARAGGIADLPKPPQEIKPGSEEEKKWYKKILKKEKKEKIPKGQKLVAKNDAQGWSNGRIINLMSTDTWRIDSASGMFHMIWTAPIQILVTLVLLIVNITYSALAGFGLLVIAMPVLGRAIRKLFVRRLAINKITDQRVTLTTEILQATRFVKFFGWETSFLDRIYAIRKKEIRAIQGLLTIRNAINAISMTMPVFASMIAFICYSFTDHNLNPALIFSSLALFNGLRMPLNFLPLVLGQVIDALASVGRIQEFLLQEEAGDDFIWDYNSKDAIVVKNGDFTWERTPTQEEEKKGGKGKFGGKGGPPGMGGKKDKRKSTASVLPTASTAAIEEKPPFQLNGIDVTIGRNELVAVIGSVGSGKSSLLAALAGEMRRTGGEITMGVTRAFCPQYAWIQNATAKENIVFGKEYKRNWYNQVVDACALRADFDMLPNGDMTEIGERGITVSGGQKQRFNIARAIYFDADLVLMDDPLSAVDAHVGRHIMDNAICGLLKNKCRVLATHQLWVLHRCDRIIVMEGGKISAIDTFDNLMVNNDSFIKLMSTTAKEDEKAEKKEVLEDEVEGEKKDQKKKKRQTLMTVEERQTDAVKLSLYFDYAKAAGGYWVIPFTLILLIMTQASSIVTNLWLSWWTSDNFGYSEGVYVSYWTESLRIIRSLTNLQAGVYAALGAGQAVMLFVFSYSLSIFGTTASRTMLRSSMYRVMRAPMSFFDTTPLGRITNRFSKDIDTMDNNLNDSYRMFLMTMGMIISVFILIIVYFHYFAVALGPLLILFLFSAGYYRASAREIKRHESVLRSFIFAKFGEGVNGVSTIRAYGLQDHFTHKVREAIDNMNGAYFLTFANQRWLSVRLDIIGNLLVFVVGILVVTSRFSINPSVGGLVLSYILSIVQMIQFTVRQLAELENNMNATERIQYYATQLEEEAPLKLMDVPESWPSTGEIIFDEVEMRYRPGLPLVLQGLNLHVKGGERIGVVGRTGAGKSTIMSTLFRMTEICGGSISIDGIDITKVGLADLRSKLSIIPQDPTLFRGTIRSNLDPFGEHTDLELWSALRQADLVGADTTLEDAASSRINLESVVEEEGLNFSLGQRQLMALARALVRNSRIIVCDEATSSVDMETDDKIQATIATSFKGRTLLCIAHRLKTIISYDRIIVMDAGRIAEVDTPLNLFDSRGVFRGMCDRSGLRRENFFDHLQGEDKIRAMNEHPVPSTPRLEQVEESVPDSPSSENKGKASSSDSSSR